MKSVVPVKKIRKRSLFVTRLSPTVSTQIVEDHLKSNLPILKHVKVTRLSTKHSTYASFHVEVSTEDYSFVTNSSIWPEGVLFKEFFGPLKPEMLYDNTNNNIVNTNVAIFDSSINVTNVKTSNVYDPSDNISPHQ